MIKVPKVKTAKELLGNLGGVKRLPKPGLKVKGLAEGGEVEDLPEQPSVARGSRGKNVFDSAEMGILKAMGAGSLGEMKAGEGKRVSPDTARAQLDDVLRQLKLRETGLKNMARGLGKDTFGAPTLEGPTLTKGSLTRRSFAEGGDVSRETMSPEEQPVTEESSASKALKKLVGPVMEGARGFLGIEASDATNPSESYKTLQAIGNMPGPAMAKGAVKALAQVPGLLEGVATSIFIGPRAALWNKAAHKTAVEMEKAGASPQEIWSATMNFRAPDGKWRQEISDFFSEYRPGREFERLAKKHNEQLDEALAANYLRQTMDRLNIGVGDAKEEFRQFFGKEPPARSGLLAKSMTAEETEELYRKFDQRPAPSRNEWQSVVGNVFEHPELYKAYPEFMSTKFFVKDKKDLPAGTTAIYDGNVVFSNDIASRMQTGRSIMAHELQHAVQNIEDFAVGGLPESNRDLYRRLAGEAEARAVQARIDMPKEELQKRFPLESYDVPTDQLIIKRAKGGPANKHDAFIKAKG